MNKGETKILNPQDLPMLGWSYFKQSHDASPPDEAGLPCLAFTFRGKYGAEEVMVAVSHLKRGCAPNMIKLNDRMVAIVTGKENGSCTTLLSDLKRKCLKWEVVHERATPALKVAELMAKILSCRCEVAGLVAGWEFESEMSSSLYRVDGTGVLIKGKKLVSGSGVAFAYAAMDLELDSLIERSKMPSSPPRPSISFKKVVCDLFVSVYRVGPGGCANMDRDINAVKYMDRTNLFYSRLKNVPRAPPSLLRRLFQRKS
ncbi:OLC1v1026581C1 [Oldenlandia corymbosa var. corymbosa]|uniref:OLC1v1026581C1 n=1 Tax=Oldenlandia corymbosa var. corymbosa TaxID=529605 RepID=A0AAV1C7E2_OLDCO|nr:OLC1v1026581C1 [Oldenlandia corymbosa var. corymbosa]